MISLLEFTLPRWSQSLSDLCSPRMLEGMPAYNSCCSQTSFLARQEMYLAVFVREEDHTRGTAFLRGHWELCTSLLVDFLNSDDPAWSLLNVVDRT